jgi:hypothetical protein
MVMLFLGLTPDNRETNTVKECGGSKDTSRSTSLQSCTLAFPLLSYLEVSLHSFVTRTLILHYDDA